jgi:hypothetical protein
MAGPTGDSFWPWLEPFSVRQSLKPFELSPPQDESTVARNGTYKTVTARFRLWLEPFSVRKSLTPFKLFFLYSEPAVVRNGTYKTVEARFWPWLEPVSVSTSYASIHGDA